VNEHEWCLGNEVVHVDMSDACAGVKKGCDDWWLVIEAMTLGERVDED
jgi:hypothetical protein